MLLTPDQGYELSRQTVTDKDGKEIDLTDKGNGKYAFVMPSGKVSVSAAFGEVKSSSAFVDVPADSCYEDGHLTRVLDASHFAPDGICTRAQAVTFLWRSQKSSTADSAKPFADVSADAYYADAVLWAVKESVTTGTTATAFSPDSSCTRAQIVTFLWRLYADK